MAGITVGVDGSHGAQKALEWAMKEAAAHHAPLTALTVHEVASDGWTGNPDHPSRRRSRSWRRPVTRRRRRWPRSPVVWANRGPLR